MTPEQGYALAFCIGLVFGNVIAFLAIRLSKKEPKVEDTGFQELLDSITLVPDSWDDYDWLEQEEGDPSEEDGDPSEEEAESWESQREERTEVRTPEDSNIVSYEEFVAALNRKGKK